MARWIRLNMDFKGRVAGSVYLEADVKAGQLVRSGKAIYENVPTKSHELVKEITTKPKKVLEVSPKFQSKVHPDTGHRVRGQVEEEKNPGTSTPEIKSKREEKPKKPKK